MSLHEQTGHLITGSYDPWLVTLSVIVAMFTSYAALSVAARVYLAVGQSRSTWHVTGALVMGAGIWSMHFVGMLAFHMPMPMHYDNRLTLLSMLLAMLASWCALRQVSRPQLSRSRVFTGGLYMGSGISAMHYLGMEAMRMEAEIRYDPVLVLLSIVIGITASVAALALFIHFRKPGKSANNLKKLGSAVLMGGAISSMHYTGMAATRFIHTGPMDAMPPSAFSPAELGVGIGIAAVGILVLVLLAASERRPAGFGITSRIAGLSFMLVIITALAVAVPFYHYSSQLLVERQLEELDDNTEIAISALSSSLQTLKQDVLFLVGTPPVQGILRARNSDGMDLQGMSTESAWKDRLIHIFHGLLSAKPHYRQIRLIGLEGDGRELVRVDRTGAEISVIGPEQMQQRGRTTWFQEAHSLNQGEVFLSDVTLNREHGKVTRPLSPMMQGAAPVYGPDGAVAAVLVVNMDFTPVLDEIVGFSGAEQMNFVMNQHGDFLGHPDPERRFGFEFGDAYRMQDEFPGVGDLHGTGEGYQPVRRVETPNGVVLLQANDIHLDSRNPGRYLMVVNAAHLSRLEGKASLVLVPLAVITLVLITVGVMLALGLARVITRPLSQITRAAELFAEGKETISLPESTGDEVGILAHTFRKMMNQVRANEAQTTKLSSALEQTADSVMITDCDGLIEYVNPAFELITGFSRSEVLGKKPGIVGSGRHDKAFYKHLWETILKGDVYRDVFINRRKDGVIYYEEKTITPLKDAKGEIVSFISSGKDITERMQTEERMHHLAYHDVLTDLPNRALFMGRLQHALNLRRGYLDRVAVLFLDTDRFKTINDSLGHEIGDQLLKGLSERLTGALRKGDTLARIGGDEFAILIENVPSIDVVSGVAQKLIAALARPFQVEGHELFATMSIGISLFPDDGVDAGALLRHADIAMYRAKGNGRNKFRFYSTEMSNRNLERLKMENSLRRAIERGEFLLHYQPQVELVSGRIVGAEALIRWQHPELGLVSPVEFIPLLEETGLIVPVGERVLRTACEEAKAWQAIHGMPLRVAVNLSGRQFLERGLASTVSKLLEETGLDPALLELEITESVLMQEDRVSLENLRTLGKMGIRLAIDDFGTGYSSLNYVRNFPVDTLKIDRSFICDVNTNEDDANIVSLIVAMAHSLKLEVVAEGVETNEQLDFLRALNCDLVQGYLFSRPLSADDLSRLLVSDDKLQLVAS